MKIEPRIWTLPPKGDLVYTVRNQDPSLASVACLTARGATHVSLLVPARALGRKAKMPEILEYDVRAGEWKTELGFPFNVDTPGIRPLVIKKLEKVTKTINEALAAPQAVHQAMTTIGPAYKSGLRFDRQTGRSIGDLRDWRQRDGAWIRAVLTETEARSLRPRDAFDRAFDLTVQLDRPVAMQWQVRPAREGVTHVTMQVTEELLNAVPVLELSGLVIAPDPKRGLTAEQNRLNILAAQFMALALALRLYAADALGLVIISAFEASAQENPDYGLPLAQLRISQDGWFQALRQMAQLHSSEFSSAHADAARFAIFGQDDWVSPPHGLGD